DLKKGHVERTAEAVKARLDEGHKAEYDLIDDPRPDWRVMKEVLELRQDAARASPKKYYAIQRCVDRIAGVLRNSFQFAGAGRTWRWAGRIFQPQNLPRP